MALESIPAPSGFRVGHTGHAYSEAAFRYLLDADRRRAERSQRSIILLLVSIRREPGRSMQLNDATGAALLGGLAASIREVDFVGWFRDGRVMGAVMPQTPGAAPQLRAAIAQRIVSALQKTLPPAFARQLHVRVVQLDAKEQR